MRYASVLAPGSDIYGDQTVNDRTLFDITFRIGTPTPDLPLPDPPPGAEVQ